MKGKKDILFEHHIEKPSFPSPRLLRRGEESGVNTGRWCALDPSLRLKNSFAQEDAGFRLQSELLAKILTWMALVIVLCALCGAQSAAQSAAPPDQSQSQSSSTTTTHEKSGPNSSRSVHHVRVEDEGSVDPDLTKAESLIEKRDYASAGPLLRSIVEKDPANYVAWFDLGFALNGQGKIDDSIAAYRKSVAAKPDAFEPNLNLGLQLAKAKQPEAEQFLRAATTLKPTANAGEGRARAWISLAQFVQSSKPDDALAACHEAATLTPRDPEPHLIAGQILERESKFADAEQEYKQAYTLDPSSDAVAGLANIYMRGHRFAEAEEFLRKLAAAHPEDAGAHIQLGRVLAGEGKNDEAIAELQTGAKLDPTDASLQRDLAEAYYSAGHNDLAEAAFHTLVQSHPNDPEIHQSYGHALLRQKKFLEAQQQFLLAIKLKPDFGEAYGDLAFAASENKDYPLTIKALDARAKFLPELPITYFMRASAFDHLRDYKQASTNYHLFLNTANGKYPDQEWQAKHRLITIEPKK